MNYPEMMTVAELAEYLRLPQSMVYQLAREGAIPAVKAGRHWRFNRQSIDQWRSSPTKSRIAQHQPDDVLAQFASIESYDISQHAELVGKFDVRINQLASGKFHGKVDYLMTPGMMIYEEHWSRRSEVCGATPEGYITLGTNVAWKRSEIQWCGTTLDHQRFACGKQGSDVDFILPDQCHNAVILIKPEVLSSALSQQGFDLLTSSRSIDFTATAGQQLTNTITGIIRKYSKQQELLGNSFEVRSLESQMLGALSGCIEDTYKDDGLRAAPSDKVYVREAIAQAEHSGRPLTALELANATGVSQRTLNYAFKSVLNTTPYTYLQIHRLNAAHRDLAVADPGESTVTNIALKWGFGHAGRFSSFYCKFFDEMPSETLNRALIPHHLLRWHSRK